jgi:hypothetical protein
MARASSIRPMPLIDSDAPFTHASVGDAADDPFLQKLAGSAPLICADHVGTSLDSH